MTNEFTKYKEILLLSRGDILETMGPIMVCSKPSKKGWKRECVSMGVKLYVMAAHEDAINAIMSTVTGYEYVTIFCDQWARLSVFNEKENTND